MGQTLKAVHWSKDLLMDLKSYILLHEEVYTRLSVPCSMFFFFQFSVVLKLFYLYILGGTQVVSSHRETLPGTHGQDI